MFAIRQAESGTPVVEVCRKIGVSEQTYYRWKRKSVGMQTILEKNYVHIFAHAVLRFAYRELGDQKMFEYHLFVTKGLIQSIIDSGDGHDPETAFLVVSTEEEYMLLDVLDMQSKMQSTLKVADQTYDKLEVVDRKTGDTGEMFFNVTIPFAWLSNQLNKQPSPSPIQREPIYD